MKNLDGIAAARLALGAAFLAWTAFWVARAVPVMATTPLLSGSWRPGIEAHEVLEAFFTAAHFGVRWLPVAVLLLGAIVWLGRRRARGTGTLRQAEASA